MESPPASAQGPLALGQTVLRGLIELIYPCTCWTCGTAIPLATEEFCSTCAAKLSIDPFPTCPRCSSTVGPHVVLEGGCGLCKTEVFHVDGAFRMAPYEGLLRDSVLRMKRWSGEGMAEVLATLWARRMAPRLAALKPDVVAPVPLHWTRRLWRGYNPSEILAERLARELCIACARRILMRVRRTPPQTAQPSATARKENVQGAFAARGGAALLGKTVLLVDDVLTTGATINNAARTLREFRPKAIYAVVLAHGR